MNDETQTPVQWVKGKGNVLSHSTSLLLLTFLTGSTVVPVEFGIATKAHVQAEVQAAMDKIEDDVQENGRKVDRLFLDSIIDRIEKILRFKCMNPGDLTMDSQLRDLEADYRDETGSQYQRPSCEFLIDSR